MPDQKVSELSAAAALTGAELLYLVQGASGVKAAIRLLLAGLTAVADATGYTLLPADNGLPRAPTGTLSYTINASTLWPVAGNCRIYLPASGTISFVVSGGATINGGTSTLTRTLAGNLNGWVELAKVQGTDAYGLSGA